MSAAELARAEDQLYRELILDHYKNPRRYGRLEPADAAAEGQNPLCGDEVTITLQLAGDQVEAARFEGRGCAVSQAAASLLLELVEGRPLEAVCALGQAELLEELGIPLTPARLKCALLPLATLRVALGEAPAFAADLEGLEAERVS